MNTPKVTDADREAMERAARDYADIVGFPHDNDRRRVCYLGFKAGWQAARSAQSEDVDNLKMIIRRVYRKLKIGRPESAIHLLDEAHDMWRGSPLRDESIKSAEGK